MHCSTLKWCGLRQKHTYSVGAADKRIGGSADRRISGSADRQVGGLADRPTETPPKEVIGEQQNKTWKRHWEKRLLTSKFRDPLHVTWAPPSDVMVLPLCISTQ